MVKFLKTVEGRRFSFKEGEVYESKKEPCESLKGFIMVGQPKTSDGKQLWSKFPLSELGKTMELVK